MYIIIILEIIIIGFATVSCFGGHLEASFNLFFLNPKSSLTYFTGGQAIVKNENHMFLV